MGIFVTVEIKNDIWGSENNLKHGWKKWQTTTDTHTYMGALFSKLGAEYYSARQPPSPEPLNQTETGKKQPQNRNILRSTGKNHEQ